MYYIALEKNKYIPLNIQLSQNQISGSMDGKAFTAEIQALNTYEYFIQYKHHSYNILVLKVITDEKKIILKINGKRTSIHVKDKFDILLQQLGIDKMSHKKTENIKAPMPGKVLNILVSEGQAIKKGDTILILEAMKMENALKAPHDGIVKKIVVHQGTAVEKNQLLIEF